MELPQGSVLAPILLLIYINDLDNTIKYCKVHHFEDDANLLHFNSSVKKRNRLVNLDMKHLPFWLNEIHLNIQKTKLLAFKEKKTILDHEVKINFKRKRDYSTPDFKSLAAKVNNYHHHITDIAAKLKRAKVLLSKIRNYVIWKMLKSTSFATFGSYLKYNFLIWAPNFDLIQRILILQKKLSK